MSIGIDLQRFNHFKDAEIRSCDIISATEIHMTFALQDEARAFDWITLTLEFYGVSDAKLLDNSKLNFIDMSDGISLVHEKLFAFCIGNYATITHVKDSLLYIICENIKYKEGSF